MKSVPDDVPPEHPEYEFRGLGHGEDWDAEALQSFVAELDRWQLRGRGWEMRNYATYSGDYRSWASVSIPVHIRRKDGYGGRGTLAEFCLLRRNAGWELVRIMTF
ncbi:MAG: hypothetical protein KDC95_00800 [Planctomycetes bacterium]|nr:hypothetical protein [Planctomycetota bacterium]